MENTTTPAVTPVSVGIRYGLIVGVIGLVIDLISRSTGMAFKMPYIMLAIVAALWIVGMVLAHKFFKKSNAGYMTYGQGLVIGLMMGLIYGVLSAVFNYVYINFMDPNYVVSLQEYTRESMAKFNVPEEALDKAMADMTAENLASPMSVVKNTFGGAIGGLVLSLIVSAFTKNKRPEFE
ncbi:DUF4199 domain-containing protein [Hymenobacter terrestris]|uniref:DUF4199 domain-containing protein n=1 Tax=Hymenobacter terrestris TaxID=2748310 RepID=A0ABX2Q502_9BACT|nr:DUF4199 domain-containing protein [Hymenobacter terrestris]NVO86050.1 DUF4199 domain-containing protein [Hymenobacter terrestris]